MASKHAGRSLCREGGDVTILMGILALFFYLLALGAVVVAYGTAVRNSWGINLEPVSCPRCGTPLPRMRDPRSLRQALWGGWTCPVCGTGVDKWGRETAVVAPRTIVKPESQMRRTIKKRMLIMTVVAYFCLALLAVLLVDFVRLGGLPSSPIEWVVVIGISAVATAVLTVFSYFTWWYVVDRFFLRHKREDPASGGGEVGPEP
jgi:hypothetical protein